MVRLRKNTAMFSKGSLFVDDTIALPIFILTLGILLQFVITIGREEKAYYTAETTIQSLGAVECKMKNLGHVVDDPDKGVYIEHVQSFPIIIPNTYLKAFVLSMDMPYKTFIEESPDKYKDSELVWIFPKNEGDEKEVSLKRRGN